MINLLPTDYADSIRYGRQNSVLRKWLIGGGIAIAGLLIILFGGWVYLGQQSKSYQRDIDVTNQQLQAQNLAGVQKDAKEITGDINTINKILSQEVRFSDLIQAIGKIMPPGTVLGNLSLSNKVNGALDLSANAKDYASATSIAVNLNDPSNQLFSKVDIVSINCSTSATGDYPCTVSMRALFSNDAQKKFLSSPTAGAKS